MIGFRSATKARLSGASAHVGQSQKLTGRSSVDTRQRKRSQPMDESSSSHAGGSIRASHTEQRCRVLLRVANRRCLPAAFLASA